MAIHVICSGCLKRFQVGTRYAGMDGPCPSCGAVIAIPKQTVKILGAESAGETSGTGKKNNQRIATSPILRIEPKFDPIWTKYGILGVVGILLLAFIIGCIPMWDGLRATLGILGLCLVTFPLMLFGYHILRDQDKIFFFSGEELYRRAGIVATGYVTFWIGFEYFLAATGAGMLFACLYLGAFAILATLLVLPLLELQVRDAFLHFCIFAMSVIVLRYFIGFDWVGQSSELVRRTAAPPPPFLPGM